MNAIKRITAILLIFFCNLSLSSEYSEAYLNAIDSNQVEMIEQLLQIGMDINTSMPGMNHEPPIVHAITKKNYKLVQFLIGKGANVNLTDDGGYNALSILLSFPLRFSNDGKYEEALKTLDLILPKINDINFLQGTSKTRQYPDTGTPALSLAIDNNKVFNPEDRIVLVKKILKYKPDVSVEDYQGKSPLVHAILNNDPHVVGLLLLNGANPNKQDATGTTLLMFSASRGQLPIVKLLIENGAKITTKKNDRGESLFSVSASSGNINLIKYLRSVGTK
jgi:ankyrin repeat protein